ncbi:hypothetical protein [Ochrobactrum vermis]|uniref:hypothetical protein n=1 Tax=Ochrobactrum vermis TaxID=1827297 RepID=UPI0015E2D79C
MKHDPKTGTTDQKPKWEGPPGNRPRGYEPADDDPAKKRDAAGPIRTVTIFPMR